MASWVQIHQAVDWLEGGGVVAYPTEAVWGLGCDPLIADAVWRILKMKQRNWRKGLILIAARFEQLLPYLDLPAPSVCERAFATWPGPYTWVFPASRHCPALITGGRATVAVRVTAHPGTARLCMEFGGPLVSTSANRSGREPARSPIAVRRQFGAGVDILVPGPIGALQGPTPIRDIVTGQTFRALAD